MNRAGNWTDLPKVDLHRHLEGSIRSGTLREIARENRLEFPVEDSERFLAHVQMTAADRGVDDFLAKFAALRHFFLSAEVVERITREAVEDAARDGIRYLELRFNPVALSARNEISAAEAAERVRRACAEAAARHDIDARLIVSINRAEPERAEEMFEIALAGVGDGITGLDLSGDEIHAPIAPFVDLIQRARDAGLGISIHAGEWAGAENVRFAIEVLGATRIGHGIRIVDDPSIIELARGRGTLLEVCITSNRLTRAIPDGAEHPVRDLVRVHGLNCTLCTDDPAILDVTLSDEFDIAHRDLGLTPKELGEMTLAGARRAFLDEESRRRLVDRLERETAIG